jgi:hypothetical protein
MLTYTHIPSALNKYTIQHARVLSLNKSLNRVRAKFQIFTRRVGNSFRNMCNSGKKNGLIIHSHNGSQSGTLEFFKKHVQPKIQKTNGSQSVASPSTTSSAAARGSVIFSLAFRSLAIFLSLYHQSFPAIFLCTNYALHAKSNLIGQWHHDYESHPCKVQVQLFMQSNYRYIESIYHSAALRVRPSGHIHGSHVGKLISRASFYLIS